MSTLETLPRQPLTFSAEQLDAIRNAGLVGNGVELADGELVESDGSPHRWTVAEAIALTELGIIPERTELLGGRLLSAMPIGPSHAEVVRLLTVQLVVAVGQIAHVWPQNPIELSDDSAPEPDVALLKPKSYRRQLPRPEETLLVIEVADTSETTDREDKLPRYAAAGIPEVWLVCLGSETVEVHRKPVGARYTSLELRRVGDELIASQVPSARVLVGDLFR